MTGFDIFSLKSHFISKYRKGGGRRNQEPKLKRNRPVDDFFFFSFIWKDILQFYKRKRTPKPAFPLRTKKTLNISLVGLTQSVYQERKSCSSEEKTYFCSVKPSFTFSSSLNPIASNVYFEETSR